MEKDYVVSEFKNPGNAYRGKPFWSWNGELDKDELLRQARVLNEMGFGGYFMHSRAGLITEYLGDEWFEDVNAVSDLGEQLGMESWLYDEDRWPSGSAGGKVTIDPQYRMKSLILYETPVDKYVPNKDDYAVYYAKVDGINIYDYIKLDAGAALTPDDRFNKVLVFRVVPDSPESVYNGTTYIDTMNKAATERFIELTHEEYKKRCGDRLGRSIKGIFTDEPHRGHLLDNLRENNGIRTCSLCYTDDIFDELERRYNYDARPNIPELYYRKDGVKMSKLKHDYVDVADALFLERFAEPINRWCKQNNIEFTGHVLHEDSFSNQTVPQGSLMRFYEHMSYPGVDVLTEFNRCYWIVKQLTSVARQLGKDWLMSELYGCTGWQFDFKAQKAVGDWQALFGINIRCHHLSWYTMEGESKRDYPGSIFHQSTYYRDYDAVESYFARFGYVMSQGRPLADVLVLNAIESIWGMMYIGWAAWINSTDSEVQQLERHYAELFHMLADNQIDFDYGDEEMISRLSIIERTQDGGAILKVGQQSYRTVVVSGMLTMRPSTYDLLKKFMDCGGKVIFAGELPEYVDSLPSDEVKKLAASDNAINIPFDSASLVKVVREETAFDIYVRDSEGNPINDIFAQVRYDDDNGNLFVVMINTNREKAYKDLTLVVSDNRSGFLKGTVFAEEWELRSGERYACDIRLGYLVEIDFSIESAGDKVFVLTRDEDASLAKREAPEIINSVDLSGEYEYTLDEPNAIVLDFVRYKFDGGEWHGPVEVLKADAAVRDMVGIEHRSGNMVQPWYSKLNFKEVYGKVELVYEFDIETMPDSDIFVTAERPELCTYTLNGTELHCDNPKDFWIDNCFKKLPVPREALKKGHNEIRMTADFMRTTNIESVYVVGDFGVKLQGNTACMTTLPKRIGNKNLCEYNMPFYTGCVSYKVPNAKLKEALSSAAGSKVLVSIEGFTGSLVKISKAGGINDEDRIILGWDPYVADVTKWAVNGDDIDVTLVCSRRNLFGPLHLTHKLQGAYGPGHFTLGGDAWSDMYELIDSRIDNIKLLTAK